jgi:hypothetical protein
MCAAGTLEHTGLHGNDRRPSVIQRVCLSTPIFDEVGMEG